MLDQAIKNLKLNLENLIGGRNNGVTHIDPAALTALTSSLKDLTIVQLLEDLRGGKLALKKMNTDETDWIARVVH